MRQPVLWMGLGIFAACAAAQAARTAPNYQLKIKWSKGASLQLKITTTVSGFSDAAKVPGLNGGKLTFIGAFRATVSSVDESGATVQSEMGPFLLPSGDAVLPKSTSIQHIDSLGFARENGDYFGPQFPKESIKVGAIWKGNDPLSGGNALGMKGLSKYRLISVRTIAGRRVADLGYETISGNGLAGKGKLSVDVATGRLINGVGSYQVHDAQAGAGRTLQIDITVAKT